MASGVLSGTDVYFLLLFAFASSISCFIFLLRFGRAFRRAEAERLR